MPQPTNQEFREIVRSYLARTNISRASFGKKANNDSRFVFDMEKGREYGEKIKKRVLDYIFSHPSSGGESTEERWEGM